MSGFSGDAHVPEMQLFTRMHWHAVSLLRPDHQDPYNTDLQPDLTAEHVGCTLFRPCNTCPARSQAERVRIQVRR